MGTRIKAREAKLLIALIFWGHGIAAVLAQTSSHDKRKAIATKPSPAASGPQLPVTGSGTEGQLSKWTGLTGNKSVLGDSTITETKDGNIGVGTATPASRLTVLGTIETVLGGLKFPDGSLQTTAAVSGLSSISHDTTLTGTGSGGSPLAVAVPLNLTGSLPCCNVSVLSVTNTSKAGGGAVQASGADGSAIIAPGDGVDAFGGKSISGDGGRGYFGTGGPSDSGIGGSGVFTVGGASNSSVGGTGVFGIGGVSNSSIGGGGVVGAGALGAIGGGTGVQGLGGPSGSGKGGDGVLAEPGTGPGGVGLAGLFIGDVQVTGTLSKAGGSFKIDHPLDPANKYLYHSFVESPDMKNIYDGVIVLGANGEATVQLPYWFGALNRDFRYLLTPIGAPAPNLYIAEKISNNRFKIAGGQPGMEVSWQVTGIRHDAWADANRIPVEEDKSEQDRGHYLHPEMFNQPEDKSVLWVHHPELARRANQTRRE